jgi:hypothetical protein
MRGGEKKTILVVDSRTEMSVHKYKYAFSFSGGIWGMTFALYLGNTRNSPLAMICPMQTELYIRQ